MAKQKQGGGSRKIGRNKGTPKAKKYERKYMTMQGMMGRKIRALMKSNNMSQVEAMRHWKKNRKRGIRNV